MVTSVVSILGQCSIIAIIIITTTSFSAILTCHNEGGHYYDYCYLHVISITSNDGASCRLLSSLSVLSVLVLL